MKLPKFNQKYKTVTLLFCAVFCFIFLLSTLVASSGMSSPSIRSDGKGYYLFLPAVFIHKDITMKWTEPMQKDDPPGRRDWYGISKYHPNAYLNKYPIGLAILWTPFFMAAHFMANVTGQVSDGFTFWYQLAVITAAAFYSSLACVTIYLLLRRYFSVKVSAGCALLLLLATNMLSYATYDSSFTHVYSLFLIAGVMYFIPKWYADMSYRNSAILASLVALAVLVRQTNVLILILVALWGVTSYPKLLGRLKLFWRQRLKIATAAAVGAAVIFPQLLYYKFITGHWFIFSYRGEGFNFLHPQIFNVLFSPERGAFFWAPLLVIGLFGLLFLRKHLKAWWLAIWVFLPIWLWVMASWHSWHFGMSYGHRVFIDIFPIFALGLAAVYASIKQAVLKKAIIGASVIFVFANLFLTYQYWNGSLRDGTTLESYFKLWKFGISEMFKYGIEYGFLGIIAVAALTVGPFLFYLTKQKASRTTQI